MKYNILDEYTGSYFRGKRESRKYSMQFVADVLQIQKSTYYYYEIGKISMPREYMKKLLNLYNDDGDAFLNGMEKTCRRFVMDLFAYINGYEIKRSEENDDASL